MKKKHTWPSDKKPATSITVVNSLGNNSGLFTPTFPSANPTPTNQILNNSAYTTADWLISNKGWQYKTWSFRNQEKNSIEGTYQWETEQERECPTWRSWMIWSEQKKPIGAIVVNYGSWRGFGRMMLWWEFWEMMAGVDETPFVWSGNKEKWVLDRIGHHTFIPPSHFMQLFLYNKI